MLLLGRGFFWLARDDDRDAARLPEPAAWPGVVAVVPARDEAATIGETVRGLLAQDYPGAFRLVVVDDRSTDGTGEAGAGGGGRRPAAGGAARRRPAAGLDRQALGAGAGAGGGPGTRRTACCSPMPISATARTACAGWCARAVAEGRVLVSLMARLRCDSAGRALADPGLHLLLPDALPLPLVQRPGRPHRRGGRRLRAAGPAAFERAGGLAPIRGAIIDDCALARRMKAVGPIWTGLTERVESLRPYEGSAPIRRMVARTAYAQLGYRVAALVGMIAALALVFLAPPLLAVFAEAAGPLALGACRLGGDGAGLCAHAAPLRPVPAAGAGLAGNRRRLHGVHPGFRPGGVARPRRDVERRGRSARGSGHRAGLNRAHTVHLPPSQARMDAVFDSNLGPCRAGRRGIARLVRPCRTFPRQRCTRSCRWPVRPPH